MEISLKNSWEFHKNFIATAWIFFFFKSVKFNGNFIKKIFGFIENFLEISQKEISWEFYKKKFYWKFHKNLMDISF